MRTPVWRCVFFFADSLWRALSFVGSDAVASGELAVAAAARLSDFTDFDWIFA